MSHSTESEAEAESRLRREFERFGLSARVFAPDSESPELDELALSRLIKGSLNETQQKLLLQFVSRFRPWHDACLNLLVAHLEAKALEEEPDDEGATSEN